MTEPFMGNTENTYKYERSTNKYETSWTAVGVIAFCYFKSVDAACKFKTKIITDLVEDGVRMPYCMNPKQSQTHKVCVCVCF